MTKLTDDFGHTWNLDEYKSEYRHWSAWETEFDGLKFKIFPHYNCITENNIWDVRVYEDGGIFAYQDQKMLSDAMDYCHHFKVNKYHSIKESRKCSTSHQRQTR